MDSGNDALENMLILHWSDPQLKFLIKHNFRRENRFEIAEKLKSVCQNITHPREGKQFTSEAHGAKSQREKAIKSRSEWFMRSPKEPCQRMVSCS